MAQTSKIQPQDRKLKLVVGIVVDQMRYDYLYRYYSKYGKGGFRRLISQGYNARNTLYPYVPTATGPGHACIYTGSVPALDGIVDNEWYSRDSKKTTYCVGDSTVQSVGGSALAGMMSPKNLLVTTVTDQLRLSNQFHSKVIGISQKDRASILPAGHTANAAYWLDGETGNFISSTYYFKSLPEWVQNFNQKGLTASYLSKDWNTLLDIGKYTESDPDNEGYEANLPGEKSPVFPHLLSKIPRKGFDLIRSTPFGNDLTKDFALAALKEENLGKSDFPDFLTISFSSTDYVGHSFGPNSIEVEDTYLRLDKDLEEILDYLDQNLGKSHVLVFLTADHGVAPTVGFNLAHNIPAGAINGGEFSISIADFLAKNFGNSSILEKFINDQIYLNHDLINSLGLKEEVIFEKLRTFLMQEKGISNLLNLNRLESQSIQESLLNRIKNGYYSKRSGDFQVILEPNWLFGRSMGANHGTAYHYDTHVPLLWYGWKIKPGEETFHAASVTDIAPTLSSFLEIEEPNGSIGKVLDIPLWP
jgi:predicted AlkP superfamily pyrophosphatase or phosphodiesterase